MQIFIDLINELSGYFSYKERTQKFVKDMEEKGSARLHVGTYDIDETLKRCYQFISEQKPDYAIVQVIENIDFFIEKINTFDDGDLDQEQPIQFKIHNCLRNIKKEYKIWKENEASNIAQQFANTWLFTEHELKDHDVLDPRVMVYIENAIKKELFKLYFYRQGNGKVNRESKFLIYPVIGISHSLEEWFSFIEKQNSDKLIDQVIVTLFLKLDYVSNHFSNFVISIHQKDSIWIASDQIDFYNPRNKRQIASRKPSRRKEDHYTNIGLPYDLVLEIDHIRQSQKGLSSNNDIETIAINTKTEKAFMDAAVKEYQKNNDNHLLQRQKDKIGIEAVANRILTEKNINWSAQRPTLWRNGDGYQAIEFKNDGKILALLHMPDDEEPRIIIYKRAEIFQKNFTEIPAVDRMYFVKLIERFFEELEFDPPTERVMLAKDFVEQKLLENGNFKYSEKGFEGFKKDHKEILNDLVKTVNMEERSLVKMSYDLVLKSPEFDRNWLGTPAALDNISRWSVLEEEAKEIKKVIQHQLKPREKSDWHTLTVMLQKRQIQLLKLAFECKPFPLDEYGSWDMQSKGKKDQEWILLLGDNEDFERRTKFSYFHNFGLFTTYPSKDHYCEYCGENKVKKAPVIRFLISHYKQFMSLLNIEDRQQLPVYFQNYRSHSQIPYHGNSNLDNTHPYSLITDPCSDAHVNGITVDIYMCKRCYNKYKKEFQPKN